MYRILLLIPVVIFSCSDTPVLPPFTGAVNEVLVVVDDHLWSGPAGDTIRHYLSADVNGIAWREPQFNVIQITNSSFSRLFQTHRNIIFIQKSNQSQVVMNTKPYARNQWFGVVEYQHENHLLSLLSQYTPVFAHRILEEEKKRFLTKSVHKETPLIEEKFQLLLPLPKKYTNVLDTNRFVWYEYSPKELELIQGFLVYEIPSFVSFHPTALMTFRDSVLKAYVPGAIQGSYMTTEYDHYKPLVNTFEKKYAQGFVVRGLWKLEKAFMGGPFIAYFLKDTLRQKTYSIEAFLYNPGENKRNLLQEMDWIMANFKTVQ